MIRHSVIFKLKHPAGSVEEKDFLAAAAKLASIPGIRNFETLRQCSSKNPYAFGLSMEFDTAADYEAYNRHPDHEAFVQTRWLSEVEAFLEIDCVPYDG